MIRRIALYAIRFSASKGKNGKDFSVFFQWDYAFRGILRSVSSSIFISFILRNARIEIPFHLKREQKKKNRCKNFSWKNLHRLKERERGGKIDPHPISSTNNETIEQMEIGDVAGYQPASHAGAKQRRPCFSSEKSGIYTPSWAQALRKQILLGKKHRVTSLYDSRNAQELELRRKGRKSDKKAEGGRDTYH